MGELIKDISGLDWNAASEPPPPRPPDVERPKAHRKAAQSGPVLSEGVKSFRLGYAFHNGKSVARDHRLAHEKYVRAWRGGDPVAAKLIGDLYQCGGYHHPRDERRSLRWYLEAAKGGDKPSQYNMGSFCVHVAQRLEDEHQVRLLSSSSSSSSSPPPSPSSTTENKMEHASFWATLCYEIQHAQRTATESVRRHRREETCMGNAHPATLERMELDLEKARWFGTARVWFTKSADLDFWSVPPPKKKEPHRRTKAAAAAATTITTTTKNDEAPPRMSSAPVQDPQVGGGGDAKAWYAAVEGAARVRSMAKLGTLLSKGRGGDLDAAAGREWWRAAADGLPGGPGEGGASGDEHAQRCLRTFCADAERRRHRRRRHTKHDEYNPPPPWMDANAGEDGI